MNNAFATLRLLWSPRSLAAVAIDVSNPSAVLASAIAISLGLATLAGTAFGVVSEPYPSVTVYWRQCTDIALRVAGLLGVFLTPWVILSIAIFGDKRRSRWAAESRAVILSSISVLPVLFLWSVVAAMAQVQGTDFGLATGRATWIMSPVISFLGSPWWLLPGVVAVTVYCERATREVRRTFREIDPPQCAECGYCL